MDLKVLISKLDFSEENLVQALLEQPKLLLEASRYRVRKMRERLQAESFYESRRVAVALRIRSTRQNEKVTEALVQELTLCDPRILEAKKRFDETKTLEEFSKLLLNAYQTRASMCKALVEIIGAEAAVDSQFIRDEYERLGVRKLKEGIRKRYTAVQS